MLIGLKATRNVGVEQVHMDSQLVVQLVDGAFEVKDEQLQRYYKFVECSKEHFVEMQLKQVPHAKNNQADELAHFASSLEDWTTLEVVAQVGLISLLDSDPISEKLDWRQPFLTYLWDEQFPSDPV